MNGATKTPGGNRWRVYLAPNPHIGESAVREATEGWRFDFAPAPEKADFVCVYGGDGAMLDAIHHFESRNRRFVGINGGTVGFLMNERGSHVDEESQIIFHKLWKVVCEIELDGHPNIVVEGFNDVRVERDGAQVVKMGLSINGMEIPQVIAGDGIMAVTPQGSTGYNQSAGGRVILPGVPVLQITPVACKVNKVPLQSLILGDTAVVSLTLQELDKRPVRILADNRIIPLPGKISAVRFRRSVNEIELGFLHRDVFLERMFGAQYHF